MSVISISALQRAAEKFDPTLRMLPFADLLIALQSLGINLLEVVGKDTFVEFQRKGGISKPYAAGVLDVTDEIGKAIQRSLQVETSYVALKDHIANYKSKLVIGNDVAKEGVNNQTKKHPLEMLIVSEKVKTIGEDILDALFFAKRDEDDKSPMGMFDGYNEQIDTEVSGGAIATGKGNLRSSGSLAAPADEDDVDAWNALVAWIRGAHPLLRKNCVLYIPETVKNNCSDALGNKIKNKNAFDDEVFISQLKTKANIKNLLLVSDYALGSGDRIMLTRPGVLDFGMNTKGDFQFVQVRSPYEDPNYVQFWSQWDAGTRIRSIHEKNFMMNEGTPVSTELSGDYS